MFLIQGFIIETERGGLSGLLFNSCSKRERLDATAKAMWKYGVKPLIAVTQDVEARFVDWRARSKNAVTWEEARRICISDARLEVLEPRLSKAGAKGDGLVGSKLLAPG